MKFNTIVVSGKSNTGKTSVLKAFAIELSERDGVTSEDPENLLKEDFWCSFIINGKRIGVITFGDKACYIKRAFRYLDKCDYYICASHLYGKTVEAILELKDKYNIINPIFINKIGNCYEDDLNITDDNNNFKNQLFFLFDVMIASN